MSEKPIENVAQQFGEIVNAHERILKRTHKSGEPFSADEMKTAQDLSASRKISYELAGRDPLTELYNRRGFKMELETEIARAKRFGQSVVLLILDIDHFKEINDRFGHLEGDEVLTAISREINSSPRKHTDLVGRWGGEEFIVALSFQGKDQLRAIEQFMERLPKNVRENEVLRKYKVTLSAGCSIVDMEADRKFNTIMSSAIREADEALYKAKGDGKYKIEGETGRNRVFLSTNSGKDLLPLVKGDLIVYD